MKYPKCHSCTKRAVPMLFLGNLFLAIFKAVIGILGNSAGLVADGVHSATDSLSSAFLYVGLKMSDKPADVEHPYGHRNIEFIIAKVVSIFLLMLGIFIFFSAIYKLMFGELSAPDYMTFVAAVFSIVANIVMHKYGKCVGTQLNSPAVLSVAYEIKADAMSSIAIAIGILFADLGFPYLDPIAACVVSILIVKNAIHMLLSAMDGLMDSTISDSLKRKITNLLLRHPEVIGIEFLRSRMTGREVNIEAGLMVDASTTVEQSDEIVRDLKGTLMNLVDNLRTVDISVSSAYQKSNDEPEELEEWELEDLGSV